MSTPVAVLRIDTSGTAFGATPTWTDRTSYLMSGSQYPVEITRGRSDERADVDPATCSFYLKNDTGFWSPGNAAAPANWKVGCPVNVRLTHASVTYDRFTGHVDSIEPTWPGGVQSWSVVKVTATDVSSRLGFAQPLRSIAEHEMLVDDPWFLYSLGEGDPSSSAADSSSPPHAPATRVDSTYGASPLQFGQDMTGMLDEVTGVTFGPNVTGNTAATSTLQLPPTTALASWLSIEAWVMAPGSFPAALAYIYDQVDPNYRVSLYVDTAGKMVFRAIGGVTLTATTVGSLCDGRLHHVVGTMAVNGQSIRLYVDGVQVGFDSTGFPNSYPSAFDSVVTLGGIISYSGDGSGYQFPGKIALVAGYRDNQLSAARVLVHYQVGVGVGLEERSDQRFSRIASYAGITTSGLPTGQAMMSGQNTVGVTAVDALALVARTEGTVDYVTGAGALTFQARDFRYQKSVGLALTASDIDPGFMPRQDRQGQFNELTVTRAGGASQVAKNTAAQTADGRRDGGSFEVAPSTDADAFQGASWQVANHKDPQMRLPDLTVNLLARSDAITTSCLAADISTVVQVTSLPSNAPATTVTQFIEGWTERISVNDWRMSFFTSPVVLEDDVLVLDSATKGLLDTNVLAF